MLSIEKDGFKRLVTELLTTELKCIRNAYERDAAPIISERDESISHIRAETARKESEANELFDAKLAPVRDNMESKMQSAKDDAEKLRAVLAAQAKKTLEEIHG
jgi:hypothetical protein